MKGNGGNGGNNEFSAKNKKKENRGRKGGMAEETDDDGNQHEKEGTIHERGNEEKSDDVENRGENGQHEGRRRRDVRNRLGKGTKKRVKLCPIIPMKRTRKKPNERRRRPNKM